MRHVDIIELLLFMPNARSPSNGQSGTTSSVYQYPKEHWRTKVLTGTVKTVKFVYYYCNHCIGPLSLIIMTTFEHPKANCGKLDGGPSGTT